MYVFTWLTSTLLLMLFGAKIASNSARERPVSAIPPLAIVANLPVVVPVPSQTRHFVAMVDPDA